MERRRALRPQSGTLLQALIFSALKFGSTLYYLICIDRLKAMPQGATGQAPVTAVHTGHSPTF